MQQNIVWRCCVYRSTFSDFQDLVLSNWLEIYILMKCLSYTFADFLHATFYCGVRRMMYHDVTRDQFETSAWCGPWHGVMSSSARAASVSPRLWQDNRYQSRASTCFNSPWVNSVTTNWFIRRCESDLCLPQMINMWAVPCELGVCALSS